MNRGATVRTRAASRIGAVAVAGVVAMSAAACGGGGGTAGAKSTGTAAAVTLTDTTPAASEDIDKVSWGLETGEPTTIDPVKTGDYSSNAVVLNMCEPLLQLQPDFSVKPGLAASYTQPDPKKLVLTIRSGVKFWDDSTLTADDVVYSLQRNLDPKNRPVGGQLFRYVTGITATGPLQVTITFSQHDAQFLNTLASVSSAVSEKAFVQKAGAAYGTPQGGVMCTGPFSFEKWNSGQDIVVQRNDSYWGTKAKAKEFDFVFFTDDSTLTSALLAGQVDGAYQVPLGSLSALRNSSAGTLYYGPSTESLSIGPVAATGPAADPDVRRALDLAIDKDSLINSVLQGAGTPQKTFTPPLVWQGDAAKATYQAGYDALPDNATTDLTEAKRLVTAANASGKTLVLAIPSGNQTFLQAATIVQADAKTIGLTVKIQQMQPTAYSSLFYDPSKRVGIDLLLATGYVEVPGAYYYAPGFVLKDGLFNWTGWSDPTVTRLITEGQQSTDPQKSARDFVAAQKIFAPAELQISLATTYNRLFMNKRITGAPASFAYIGSPWAAAVGGA